MTHSGFESPARYRVRGSAGVVFPAVLARSAIRCSPAVSAIGWVGDRLYSLIFEAREDEEGEILHLVTLWRSTKEEVRLYEENS